MLEAIVLSKEIDIADGEDPTFLKESITLVKSAFELSSYILEHKSEVLISQIINDDLSEANWQQVEEAMTEILEEQTQNYLTDPDYHPLTSEERAILSIIFDDSIDYSLVRIARSQEFSEDIITLDLERYAPSLTLGNRIFFGNTYKGRTVFKSDSRTLTDTGLKLLFHEVVHVWQYQNGDIGYAIQSLWAQFTASMLRGSSSFAYEWKEVIDRVSWEDWNPEQQAQFIEDYYIILTEGSQNGFTDQ